MTASQLPPGPWAYIQPWDEKMLGDEILDPGQRARWTRAVFFAGTLPYIWREVARPLNSVIYGLLELKPGDKVLIIGEAVQPVGWDTAIRDIVGPTGQVDVVEIIEDARAAVMNGVVGRNGFLGSWEWEYTADMADAAYDCIAVLQSAQHCDDWVQAGADLLRVMKSGRRIVFAESSFVRLKERLRADTHIQAWYDRIMAPAGFSLDNVSSYGCEQLASAFDGQVTDGEALEWRGIEMFWGRKP